MAVMGSRQGSSGTETSELLVLWGAFLAGPVAWTLNQGLGYAAVQPACAGGLTPLLWLIAAGTLILTGTGGWAAWRKVQRLHSTSRADGGEERDRSYFLAMLALAFNALIGLLIATSLVPQFFLSPCV
jgi:hypothetical protein